jgi:Putative Flp pilus-assembly TadE/G-like
MRLPQIKTEMYKRRHERGQTIAIVAVSMVSLLAMAALAIDLTTLYVARGEIQRAADSAALAGAKAFVDSGVTSNPGNGGLQAVAQQLANSYATAAASQNNVAGSSAQMVSAPTLDFRLRGNPRVTVRLQKTSPPVFFARIFGTTAASVSASATAEAYNPAFSQNNTGSYLPAAPKCVKPFLVPNADPNSTSNPPPQFVDETTGMVNQSQTFLGEQITLTAACKSNGLGQGCQLSPPNNSPPSPGEYLPMVAPSTHTYCPSDAAPGCGGANTDFEQSVECCDGNAFSFQQCGGSANLATWDQTINPGGPNRPAQSGLQCLIHTTTTGPVSGTSQQDSINANNLFSGSGSPQIFPGSFNQSRYNVSANSMVDTSDSIITVPLFHLPKNAPMPSQVTVVGFLQLFVDWVQGPQGQPQTDMTAHIVNIIGCGTNTASGAPVSGGGVSPIPVRLIHN